MADATLAPPSADAPSAPAGKGARPRLTYAQRAIVFHARKQNPNASCEAIAETVGCSARQVYRLLAKADSELKSATLALLESATTERLDDWARAARVASRKGYHQPAKDWLIAAKAIDEPKVATVALNTGISVNLAFQLPGVPSQQTAHPTTHTAPLHTLQPTQPTANARDIDVSAIPAQLPAPVDSPTLSPLASLDKAKQRE